MNWVQAGAAIVATFVLTGGAFADPVALKELAPTGKLRVGIAIAPSPGAGNVALDASGQPRGVGGDLGRDLAKKLGVPVQWVPYPNSGALTDALAGGACDVAFLPVDNERRKKVDFGPPHIVLQSTFLVPAGSTIQSLAETDKPNLRVVGVENTATTRAAQAFLKNVTMSNVKDAAQLEGLVQIRPSRCHRAVTRVARPACGEVSRIARASRRLHELVRGGRGAQGQPCGAGLRRHFCRGGQVVGRGAPLAG